MSKPTSKITIRNLGQDVKERLLMHAKGNGRSLEGQIRVMLTAMVGLGPSERDMAGMQAQMKAMRLRDEQAMFGTLVRMDEAKKNKLATDLNPVVQRTAPQLKSNSNPL
jgi:plasmid stability protein